MELLNTKAFENGSYPQYRNKKRDDFKKIQGMANGERPP